MANRPKFEIFHIEERAGKKNYFRPVGAMWEGETKDGKPYLSIQLDALPVNFTGKLTAFECEEEKAAANS